MAPKTGKGKGVAKDAGEKEVPESELAARRTQLAYSPTAPSIASRRRSACPLWRAYSSIRCT